MHLDRFLDRCICTVLMHSCQRVRQTNLVFIIRHSCVCIETEVNIKLQQLFAVEKEEAKRNFLIRAHTVDNKQSDFCVFSDVAVFEDMFGYCHTCGKEHEVPKHLDFLCSGTSCKSVSNENKNKSSYGQCSEILC